MGNKYAYCLIDNNEGEIGVFTSEDRAKNAAINEGWCEMYYDDEDGITTPEQVFDAGMMVVQRVPLNQIYY